MTAGKIYTCRVSCDISRMLAVRNTGSLEGDVFWFAIQRNGASDSNNGDAQVFRMTPAVTIWCNGEYLIDT